MRKFCFILVLESIKQEIYWSDLWLNFQNVGFFQYFLLVAMFVGILPLNVMFHKISLKKTTTTEWIFFFWLHYQEDTQSKQKDIFGMEYTIWNKTEFTGGSREISQKPNGSVRKLDWQTPWKKIRKRN